VTAVLAAPPVEPDADTARQWAADELAKSEYHTGPSLLERLVSWIVDQVARLQDMPGPSGAGALVFPLLVVVAVVVVSLLVAGPVRRSRAVRAAARDLLLDDTRTAEQIRAAAAAAADAGDLSLATAEWFRAMVRGMEERTLLDERPGRTADEAAGAAGARLPELAGELGAAARTFDAVLYGRHRASATDEATMRALDKRVAHVRPSQVEAVV